jgi:hypothetical protein
MTSTRRVTWVAETATKAPALPFRVMSRVCAIGLAFLFPHLQQQLSQPGAPAGLTWGILVFACVLKLPGFLNVFSIQYMLLM